MTEKRFYVRIPSHMDCICNLGGTKIEGVITDFSSDGMRICVDTNVEYPFAVGTSFLVKYETSLEIGSSLAPITIKCRVAVRNISCKSNGDYAYMYRLGCQIENAVDYAV